MKKLKFDKFRQIQENDNGIQQLSAQFSSILSPFEMGAAEPEADVEIVDLESVLQTLSSSPGVTNPLSCSNLLWLASRQLSEVPSETPD